MAKKAKKLRRVVLGSGVLGSRFSAPDHASICEWKKCLGEYDWVPINLKKPNRLMFNADKPGRLIFEWEE